MLIKKGQITSYDTFKTIPPREDMSPLKIGTQGTFEKNQFTITGRIQYHFTNSYYNYWIAKSLNDTWFYITEGYGAYAYTTISFNTLKTKSNSDLKPGKHIRLSPHYSYVISQLAECTGMALEGEFPFSIDEFKPFFLLEASNEASQIQSYHLLQGEQRAFQSRSLDFDDFNFTNLRDLNGWK